MRPTFTANPVIYWFYNDCRQQRINDANNDKYIWILDIPFRTFT